NDDGVIGAKDVTTLRRYLAGGYDIVISETIADVNGDETINAKDLTILRRYLAGGYGVELNKPETQLKPDETPRIPLP
ncbi:MAG: dockerin type I repeat-containing protein, partial [Oscillospiraceae bacterium]|nr:dockerin type I repeat-containing protein [Oscillospiraceae bacterium]